MNTRRSQEDYDKLVAGIDWGKINKQLNTHYSLPDNGDELRVEKSEREYYYNMICWNPVTKAENRQEFFVDSDGNFCSLNCAWVPAALRFAGLIKEKSD